MHITLPLLALVGAATAFVLPTQLKNTTSNRVAPILPRAHDTNATESELERRLDFWATSVTPRECRLREDGIYQPMCCRHGWGAHHADCRKIVEVIKSKAAAKRDPSAPDPPRGIIWKGCDEDFNHSYCCRKIKDKYGDYNGLWYCPNHLTGMEP